MTDEFARGNGGGTLPYETTEDVQSHGTINKYRKYSDQYVDRVTATYENDSDESAQIEVAFAVPEGVEIDEWMLPDDIDETTRAPQAIIANLPDESFDQQDILSRQEDFDFYSYDVTVPSQSEDEFGEIRPGRVRCGLEVPSDKWQSRELGVWILGSFAGGSGSSSDPYQIENWNHLDSVRDNVDDSFELIANLDSNSDGYNTHVDNPSEGWDPIGYTDEGDNTFSGVFDGRGYVIKDLVINRPNENDAALFGETENALFKEVGVVDCNVVGGDRRTAALVARDFPGSHSDIIECFASGSVDGERSGGIIGRHYGDLTNCYSLVDVHGDSHAGCTMYRNPDGRLELSYAAGSVTGGSSNVGGLAADNWSDGTIDLSYWDTEATGQSSAIEPGVGGPVQDVEGLTTSEMQGSSAETEMDNLDFSSTWETVESSDSDATDDGYPILQSIDRQTQLESQGIYDDSILAIDDPIGGSAVEDWHDLDAIRDDLESDYVLVEDLDEDSDGYDDLAGPTANDDDGWEPINEFEGHFHGNHHSISDLVIDRPNEDDVGLFEVPWRGALFERVLLLDFNVVGGDDVGSLAGSSVNSEIEECIAMGSVEGNNGVGGLVGSFDLSGIETVSVEFCYADISVEGSSDVGGLVGRMTDEWNPGTTPEIEQCYAIGEVVGNGSLDFGGILGSHWDDDEDSVIDSCHIDTMPENQFGDSFAESTMTGGTTGTASGIPYFDIDDRWRAVSDAYDLDWPGTDALDDGFPILSSWNRPYQQHLQELTTVINDWAELDAIRGELAGDYFQWEDIDTDSLGYDTLASETARDASGWKQLAPSDGDEFTGTFDGDGNEIESLYTDRYGGSGGTSLFGDLRSGIVEDVWLIDADTRGGNMSGLIADYIAGDTEIRDCVTTGVLDSDGSAVGGIVGECTADSTLERCFSTVTITANDAVGGIAGSLQASSIISECGFTGSVSGDDFVGGITGVSTAEVESVFAVADVNGSDSVGGLVGTNGFQSSVGNLELSYVASDVTGSNDVGAVAGYNEVTTFDTSFIEDVYWDGEVASGIDAVGQDSGQSINVVELTTQEMVGASSESNMSELDFTDTWETVEPNDADTDGNSYAILSSIDRAIQIENLDVLFPSPIAGISIGETEVPLYVPTEIDGTHAISAVRVGLSNGDVGAVALGDPDDSPTPEIRFGLDGNVYSPIDE